MYQLIVIGLGITLIVGGGYYIATTDDVGVLKLSLVSTPVPQEALPTAEEIAGTYLCGTESGCKRPHILTLSDDGAARLDVADESGADSGQESGAWSFVPGGFVSVVFSASSSGEYEHPHAILIQSVRPDALSKYVYDDSEYPDMVKPTFTR